MNLVEFLFGKGVYVRLGWDVRLRSLTLLVSDLTFGYKMHVFEGEGI